LTYGIKLNARLMKKGYKMNSIAEAIFTALVIVIGGGIIIALLIAMDGRKSSRRALNKLDK